MPKKILIAEALGFCFGVSRAVDLARLAASSGEAVSTWGPIAHNKDLVGHLAGLGVRSVADLSACTPGQTIVVRSHGVSPQVMGSMTGAGYHVVDATCPCVARIHRQVQELEAEGWLVLILGDTHHPEVQATAARCHGPIVFDDEAALTDLFSQRPALADRPLALVAQTTARRDIWEKCTQILKKLCTNAKIIDTMCNATILRQHEASQLALRCDAMVVVGDKNSSNTRKLIEICRTSCAHVLPVENAGDWKHGWLQDKKNVGLTAGASTPPWIIEEVYQTMSEEIKNEMNGQVEEAQTQAGSNAAKVDTKSAAADTQDVDGDESFEALLEKSFKTIYTGDKVLGVITAVTPTEVHVDLGTKHAGYIPLEELTYDFDVKPEDIVHIGDEIETYVMRVNDIEGTVVLSKRRLDTVKSWEDIELARENHAVMAGVVTEENKGGVVVNVRGVRVFVPASQTGLPKDTPMSTLLRQRVKVRVTEVNGARRRVVGSIRAVQMEERRNQSDTIWNHIEIGKQYEGVVKSLTSYGCFVDIGGVDGMVHVSELSWSRVKHPSEVVSIGDKIKVYVIGFDKEKRKISLGSKDPNENPWKRFVDSYKVGDTVSVKVVKLMPFGAFAEILPGVDGLIHIGQITDHRIGKPGDVLSEGQRVDVKITAVDTENRKVSLSMRALLEPEVSEQDVSDALLPDTVVAASGEPTVAVIPETETAPEEAAEQNI